MTSIYKPSKDEYILYNKIIILNPEAFSLSLMDLLGRPDTNLQRGRATYFEYSGIPLVLKHYFRGGMMEKLSRDKYLWIGLSKTRVFREWKLLEAMNVLNLPVPTPVAARIMRHTIYYNADLITRRIDNTTALGELLKAEKIDSSVWSALGQLIKIFHRHGVYHADLNANNILVTDHQELYLIDFDKSYFRMKQKSWMDKMLARLKRSFYKFKKDTPGYNFSENNWEQLLEGYNDSQQE